MNPRHYLPIVLIGLVTGSTVSAARSTAPRKPPESDLASIESRRTAVELAVSLAKVEPPASLADVSLPQPFNPAGFGLASRDESHKTADVAPGPVKAFGDKEVLAALAPRIMPTGTFSMGGDRLLMFGKKKLKAGDRLTVNFEGQDYTLELVAIDRTNFTLRYNREEITRPIKPGKTP
jgi:hypothetical protein